MQATIQECIANELNEVKNLIQSATDSNIDLIKSIQSYALSQPERKLIRPTILLLQANAIACQNKDYLLLAAIIEMIHGATLLHDDVIDKAATRRNMPTTHYKFGTNQSILMGDFIYASAFKLIANIKDPAITEILADATKEIVEGEILQLSIQGSPQSLEDYTKIIHSKTALLFITGAKCLERLTQVNHQALSNYSYHFGMLYQITDDILDIDVSNTELNKAHGTDLKEGKMTLPILLAYQQSNDKEKTIIENILNQQTPWQDILPIIEKTNAIELCLPYMEHHLDMGSLALSPLQDTVYKTNLLHLLSHIPKRKR